jgi:competence protein ComEC
LAARSTWQTGHAKPIRRRNGLSVKGPLHAHLTRGMPLVAAAAAAGALSAAGKGRCYLVPLMLLVIAAIGRLVIFDNRWFSPMILLAFCLSAARTGVIVVPAEFQARQLSGKTVYLQGIVDDILYQADTYCRVLVRQESGIRIALAGPASSLARGREISALVQAAEPSGRRNPGGFNEAAWLAGKGVYLEASLVPGEIIHLERNEPAFDLATWSGRCREAFFRFASRLLGKEEAALLAGLLLGDDSRLSDAAIADFRISGLSHLTSASGTNITSLLLPITVVLKKGRFRRNFRLWAMLAAVFCFGILTGWPVSVTRAILMSGIMTGASLLKRPADPLNVLSQAAWLILTVKPLCALETGFWLSAGAAASLLLFSGPCSAWLLHHLPAMPKYFIQSLAASLCTQVVLLPIVVITSRQLSFIGLLANLLAVPIATLIMLAAMSLLPVMLLLSSCLTVHLSDVINSSLSQPLDILLRLLLGLARLGGKCACWRIFAVQLNAAFWLLWALILLGWVRKNYPGMMARSIWRKLAFVHKLRWPALLAFFLVSAAPWIAQPAVQVWFFDVGQGDSILIRSDQGYTVLIDGGKPGSGRKVLLPALDALGIRRINLAVATHGHADHCGGLIELIDDRRIDRLAVPHGLFERSAIPGSFEPELGEELLQAANRQGIKVSELTRNGTIALGSRILLKALAPDRHDQSAAEMSREEDGNACSLLLLAELQGFRLLLAADCTEETEQSLINQALWPAAEFLKVAHHGSRMTTTEDFLSMVKPEAAMISVGPNLYGHPAQETLQRLEASDCRIFRTDRQGAIWLAIFRGIRSKRYWHMATMLP